MRDNVAGFNAVMVYTTETLPDDILGLYKDWMTQYGWAPELQPKEKPRTAYARRDQRTLQVTTVEYQGRTLVTVSYATDVIQ